MPQKEEPRGTPERRDSDDRTYEAPELRELGAVSDLTGIDSGGSSLDGQVP